MKQRRDSESGSEDLDGGRGLAPPPREGGTCGGHVCQDRTLRGGGSGGGATAFAEAEGGEKMKFFLGGFEPCAWDVVFSHGSALCGFEPCAWDAVFSRECAPMDIEELHLI